LSADALVGATFAISPLAQLGFALNFGRMTAGVGQRREQGVIRDLLKRRDLQLLMAIRHETRSYVPGFMFAYRRPEGSLGAELHQVASTPKGVVARQMNKFLGDAHTGQRPVSAEVQRIMAVLKSGEDSFAQRIAWELRQLWSGLMSARWAVVRSLMEGDIRHRATSMVRHGLSVTLNSLHPAFSYGSGALCIRDERTRNVFESKRIVLHPSPLQSTWVLRDDPWGEDGTHLAYPVGTSSQSEFPAEEPPLAQPLGGVIGQARLLLLSDLESPRTTTELAERHYMSASTVSYHLLRLHRGGLLNRMREGSKVYYQRTPEADRLVARSGRGVMPGELGNADIEGALPPARAIG
jgi:DNA-binding transcriptional ArsR family regulator